MLWLTLPQPSQGKILPIFYLEDFKLRGYGSIFTHSNVLITQARQANIKIKAQFNPDLVLSRNSDNLFLLIECKLKSFGSEVTTDSSPTYQANALLCSTGVTLPSSFNNSTSAPVETFLLYAVNGPQEEDMNITLQELNTKLQNIPLRTIPSGSIGIYAEADGIYICLAQGSNTPVKSLADRKMEKIKVVEIEPNEDPTPLYIIAWDPDVDRPSKKENEVFTEKVYAAIISHIGRNLSKSSEFEIIYEDVAKEAIEIWDIWTARSRKTVLFELRKIVNSVAKRLRSDHDNIVTHPTGVIFRDLTPKSVRRLKKTLQSSKLRQSVISPEAFPFQMRIEWENYP